MKCTVACSCGHEFETQLYGTAADREKKIAWYRTSALCPACYKAQQARERLEGDAKRELPALEGSDKQIDWAREIRFAKLRSNCFCPRVVDGVMTAPALVDEINQAIEIAGDKAAAATMAAAQEAICLMTETSAKWFIDHR